MDDVVTLARLHAYLDAHGVVHQRERSNSTATGFRLDAAAAARVRARYRPDSALLAAAEPTWT